MDIDNIPATKFLRLALTTKHARNNEYIIQSSIARSVNLNEEGYNKFLKQFGYKTESEQEMASLIGTQTDLSQFRKG